VFPSRQVHKRDPAARIARANLTLIGALVPASNALKDTHPSPAIALRQSPSTILDLPGMPLVASLPGSYGMMGRRWVEWQDCPETRVDIGFLAEREGFEPSIREARIPDFESGAFDHSATFPG